MYFYFEVNGVIDAKEFNAEWEMQRTLNKWPPAKFHWEGNRLMVSVDSNNVPEPELRKMLNMSLGSQKRRLKEV